jgi:type IX secretion system PorP/SprF family membrane protein
MNINHLHKKYIFNLFFLFFAFCTEGSLLYAQQEGNHTLFMYNPLAVNPGAAGINGYTSYTFTHRSQWIGFKGAPTMQYASVSTPAFSERLGFGLSLENRKIGIFETQTIAMAWAYSLIKTPRFNCRAGLQGVVKRTALRFNDLEEASLFVNDRSVVPTVSSRFVSNFGMGLFMTFDDAFLGFSIPSYLPNVLGINPFSATTAAESAHFYAQGGLKFKLAEGIKMQPSAMVKWVKNAPWSIDANVSLIVKDKVNLGMSYRVGRTTLAMIGESADLTFLLQVNEKLAIGAAYDWLLAPVSKYSSGSAEVMLRYDIKQKKEVVFSNPRSFF